MAFIATPTFVAYFDNTIDLSYVYSTTEEEQNGDERTFGEKHNKLINTFQSISLEFIKLNRKNAFSSQNLKLNAIYFELHSPPPEHT